MGLLLVTPVAGSQRILETIGDNARLDGKVKVEVLTLVDELLSIHSHLLRQITKQAVINKQANNKIKKNF